jgi:archaellum component FlaC
MSCEEKVKALEQKIDHLEENIKFLKDLLAHISSQFQQFKKEIKR